METIWKQAEALKPELIARRRDLHTHPETGWTEFRTASLIINELKALGYEVHFGAEVVAEKSMMGRPSVKELEAYMKRAITEGKSTDEIREMAVAEGMIPMKENVRIDVLKGLTSYEVYLETTINNE